MEELEADVLIAGGGVGGLMAALRAQMSGARVILIAGSPGASNRISSLNTALEQAPQDEPAALFDDIVRAGGFINNPLLVAAMAERIGAETEFLESMKIPFFREDGHLARRRAAGTTWTRAVYSLGMIGVDISKEVRRRLESAGDRVRVLRHAWLLELLREDGRIVGGLVYVEGRWLRISVAAVVLATGGAGQLFGYTTNPPGSRGIGYALGLEAGASLVDLEFISFEPFIMAAPDSVRGRDLPTTVLREGARLRNSLGEEFLDTRSAPSKDVICRAMVREVLAGRGTVNGAVYFDLREMEPALLHRYVQIEQVLRGMKRSPAEALLEVMPAQHYLMGGIRIDETASSEVPGLYAVGEVSGGAHGAHRLAAGGGTEVVAMGAIAGESAAEFSRRNPLPSRRRVATARPELLPAPLGSDDARRQRRLRAALDSGCGILRNASRLSSTVSELEVIRAELRAEGRIHSHLGRATFLGLGIARCARLREESRGDHYRSDFPHRRDLLWLGNHRVHLNSAGDDIEVAFERAGLARRLPAKLSAAATA